MGNGLSGNTITNQDQTEQEESTIRSYGEDDKNEDKDNEQSEEVEEYLDDGTSRPIWNPNRSEWYLN